jgi:hypothetical protein
MRRVPLNGQMGPLTDNSLQLSMTGVHSLDASTVPEATGLVSRPVAALSLIALARSRPAHLET